MSVTERRIVHIDEEKCNGCGICVDACHEGAIQIVNGKAKLVSDSYCDGLGDCLAPCPTGAISIISRPAEAFDAEAVASRMKENSADKTAANGVGLPGGSGCPGMMAMSLKLAKKNNPHPAPVGVRATSRPENDQSELMNWPVQLRLVPPSAPNFKGADLLLAADCAPVVIPDFHKNYLKDKPLIIACPKLEDKGPLIDKLADIIMTARPSSLTVLRVEVPCCGGLAQVAQEAIWRSGLAVPLRVIVVGVHGSVVSNTLVQPQRPAITDSR